MTDLHTHILPEMDDGAKNVEMSLELLEMETKQGVDTVVLTPHFYRDREEPEHFIARRAAAMQKLEAAMAGLPAERRLLLPELHLGAEIAWVPNLAEWPELSRLCLGSSRYFLLELPSRPWTDQLINQLYELSGRTGLVPVLAHIERYLKTQKQQHVDALLDLGVPVQVSAEPLLHTMQRGAVLRLLRERKAQLIASDAHDPVSRPPNLGRALSEVGRRLGRGKASSLAARCDDIIAQTPEAVI